VQAAGIVACGLVDAEFRRPPVNQAFVVRPAQHVPGAVVSRNVPANLAWFRAIISASASPPGNRAHFWKLRFSARSRRYSDS